MEIYECLGWISISDTKNLLGIWYVLSVKSRENVKLLTMHTFNDYGSNLYMFLSACGKGYWETFKYTLKRIKNEHLDYDMEAPYSRSIGYQWYYNKGFIEAAVNSQLHIVKKLENRVFNLRSDRYYYYVNMKKLYRMNNIKTIKYLLQTKHSDYIFIDKTKQNIILNCIYNRKKSKTYFKILKLMVYESNLPKCVLEFQNEIMEAIVHSNDVFLLKYFQKRGIDIHKHDEYALRLACKGFKKDNGGGGYEKRPDIVRYLVADGADIHALDEVAIHMASNNLEILQFLIEKGADVNVTNDGVSLLYRVCQRGHMPHVKMVVNAGADIHYNNDIALSAAAANNHHEIVRYLLKLGCTVIRQCVFDKVKSKTTKKLLLKKVTKYI